MDSLETRTTAPREHIILAGKSAPLAGILTEPAEGVAGDRPWLILLNAGILHKVGPNRMAVQLARLAAARGMTALRIDYAGAGDCPARADGRPLIEGVIVDIREFIAHLHKTRGVERFIAVGLCSGADNALRVARVDERVVGVCMLDPTIHRTRRWYVEHFGPRIFSTDVWSRVLTLRHARFASLARLAKQAFSRQAEAPVESPELFRTGLSDTALMEAHLRDVLARQVPLFIAFSGGWHTLYNYRTQIYDAFPGIDFGDKLRLKFYPQAGHTFDFEAHRKILLGDIVDWAASAPFPGAGEGSGLAAARVGAGAVQQA